MSMRMPTDWICSAILTPMPACVWLTSTRNEPNSETAAITADPMATPLVIALVVLPTASRSAMICWASLVALSSWPLQLISPIPLALSAIGPKESMATLLPVSVSMPMPVMATP
jgi:hypothetical protein